MTLHIRRSAPPFDYRTCSRMPCARPAEVPFGGRNYCLACANEARAFVDKSASRFPKFETVGL